MQTLQRIATNSPLAMTSIHRHQLLAIAGHCPLQRAFFQLRLQWLQQGPDDTLMTRTWENVETHERLEAKTQAVCGCMVVHISSPESKRIASLWPLGAQFSPMKCGCILWQLIAVHDLCFCGYCHLRFFGRSSG